MVFDFYFDGVTVKTGNMELRSRTQLFSREMLTDTSSLRGLISRSPAILLAVGIGGIHSVEIWRSEGVKCS